MAETYFDIVVRAKNIVSQGFNDAIAQAKSSASVFNSLTGGGGLEMGKVLGAAGNAANSVGRAFDRLVTDTRQARAAVKDLADEARRLEKAEWGGLSSGLVAMAEAARHANAMLALNNDFAKKRLGIEQDIQAKIAQIEAERVKQSSAAASEVAGQAGAAAPDFDYLAAIENRENKNAEAASRMTALLKELRLGLIAEVDRAEKESRDRQQSEWEAEAEKNRIAWVREEQNKRDETEQFQEQIARQRADVVEMELRNAGKLLEADKARNAEQARAALVLARNNEERTLIQRRQQLQDEKAVRDEQERIANATKKEKAGDRGRTGFDLIEVTSRVSGFAAMQRAGWEQAFDKHAGRMEGALAQVKGVCGQIVQAINGKRMEGIAVGF